MQEDGKISFAKMAKSLRMAASSIHNRVKKMEKEGIIKKYNAIIDSTKVGYPTTAWVGLSVDPLRMKEIANQIAKYDEIQIVASSIGDQDIVLQLAQANDKDLWRFINKKIKTILGVKSTMNVSSFIDVFKNTIEIKFKVEE